MDLIIKPTMKCNFACTFCSSNNIAKDTNELSNELLYKFISNNDIKTIIVNGGDPLMMPPQYYWDMIKFLDKIESKAMISLTTNLWDFYKYPDKWTKLFKHPRIGVCTSFQFGNERRLASGQIFTKDLFRKVFALFEERIGYKVHFIAVITEKNEDTVLDMVRFSKKIGTECKINAVLKSGRATKSYPFYKIISKYLDIIEAGLAPWEFNSREIQKLLRGIHTVCPYNRNCYKTIRALSPDGLVHSCGALNDDHYSNLELGKPTYELSAYKENQIFKDNNAIKSDCYSCEMFQLCNSCFKQIADIKECGEVSISTHCSEMKKLQSRLESVMNND